MHRFYFHLYEAGECARDTEGRELRTFEIALQEAATTVRDIIADDVRRGKICLESYIEIADSYGIPLATIFFDEAITIQGNARLVRHDSTGS